MNKSKFKEKTEKAKKVMDDFKIFLKEFDKFKEKNKDNYELIMGISMAFITMLLNTLAENPLATIGMLEAIKTHILTNADIIGDIGDTNYIG